MCSDFRGIFKKRYRLKELYSVFKTTSLSFLKLLRYSQNNKFMPLMSKSVRYVGKEKQWVRVSPNDIAVPKLLETKTDKTLGFGKFGFGFEKVILL